MQPFVCTRDQFESPWTATVERCFYSGANGVFLVVVIVDARGSERKIAAAVICERQAARKTSLEGRNGIFLNSADFTKHV